MERNKEQESLVKLICLTLFPLAPQLASGGRSSDQERDTLRRSEWSRRQGPGVGEGWGISQRRELRSTGLS